MANIFSHINNVNRAMQGPGVTIMNAAEKLNAFLLKLSLEKCRLEVGNYASFPLLEDLILKNKTRKESDIFISMRKEFCSHLDTLQTFFKGYFNLGSLKDEAWIQNPFLIDLNIIDDEDPNNTLVLSRTEGVRSHLNSLTHRFPQFPPKNLCSLFMLAVSSLVFAATDTAFF